MIDYLIGLFTSVLLGFTACGLTGLSSARADDGLFLELGIGAALRQEEGRDPRSVIRLRYEMDNRKWWTPDVVEWNHHSSVLDGRPFNDRPERTTDQVSMIWRFRLGF